MTRIKLDEVLKKKLHDLTTPLELCDEEGKIVAWVTPLGTPKNSAPGEPEPLSEEEYLRREAEPDFSTQELLAHLGKQ